MKPTMKLVVAILFLALATTNIKISFCNGSTYNVGCIDSERQALLRFKQDLKDPSNRLASWSNISDGNCCTWAGVVCNNSTGHVMGLHLGNPWFYGEEGYEKSRLIGKINPSLLDLKHLVYLNLSNNDFEGTRIPGFLGSVENLRYIDLSKSGFIGMIPHQLGNLSNLQYLDLSYGLPSLYLENFSWLSGFSLLKHLDLSGVDLSRVSDWLSVTNMLPALQVLKLSYCSLRHSPQLHTANFSSLATLDLSFNEFDSLLFPSWVFGLSHLAFLDVSANNFQGPIPDGLQNLTSLSHLDLSFNNFNSSILNYLYKFRRLEHLLLVDIGLHDMISSALGNLTSLRELDLSFNRIGGRIPRTFSKLCSLRSLSISNADLSQEISEVLDIFKGCVSDVIENINLRGNQLSGHLNNQLRQFKILQNLLLDSNLISGHIPTFLGELSSLQCVFLSNNRLNGTLSEIHFTNLTNLLIFLVSGNSLILEVSPFWVPPFKLIQILGLGSCNFGRQFPSWLDSLKQLELLDMSNSEILDTIPRIFWESHRQLIDLNLSRNQIYGKIPDLKATQLESLDLHSNYLSGALPSIPLSIHALDLSNNTFNGSIFQFLCYGRNEPNYLMRILNLRDNFLSGELPDCWMNWQNLLALNLGYNEFTGSLPASMGTLTSLRSLHLIHNKFFGPIPASLQNCTNLLAADISGNEFSGNIPTWMGDRLSRLVILNLKSNKFHGHIPAKLCHLSSLQILDVSNNNLSGPIPRCINNLTAMLNLSKATESSIQYLSEASFGLGPVFENEIIVTKGKAMEYSTILKLVRSMDLSGNNLSGDIPVEMTDLVALQSLNLSHNFFTGRIPENIGAMRSLESVDFSGNQLCGRIPEGISSLTYLSHLNLSSNNLTGKIPSGTQLQSFDASCYIGNDLCGSPLTVNCTEDAPIPEDEEDEENGEVEWLYVSMGVGFVVGFWSVIGPLFLSARWRYKYCYFLDRIIQKFGCLY
ncbi:Leucine-rich receptor-like kinase family protein [Melia azedarach]|uniref:Leucine-rich receptor-like kinase family protein n=1 Tax=Melia azedarach TaxID=155640 RepID=A0ACC1YSG3_MELAZ|nr:Leucine-rich receptor-like kinase family protein [Melia azedarach]